MRSYRARKNIKEFHIVLCKSRFSAFSDLQGGALNRGTPCILNSAMISIIREHAEEYSDGTDDVTSDSEDSNDSYDYSDITQFGVR